MWWLNFWAKMTAMFLLIAVVIWERKGGRSRYAIKVSLAALCIAFIAWGAYLRIEGYGP